MANKKTIGSRLALSGKEQTPHLRPSRERRYAMTAAFLVRNPATGDIEKGRFAYAGPVPTKVWERYAKKFLKLNAAGYFWPYDSMEAYQEGVAQIAATAEKIRRGEVTLVKASPDTYLTNVGTVTLLHFHQRKVKPARHLYREVERQTYGRGAIGIDPFDTDNLDIYELVPSAECRKLFDSEIESEFDAPEMTARELGELLPGVLSGEIRIRLATQILNALFEHLPEEAVQAFRGYLAADGNFVEAARLSAISKSRFYRLWPGWIRSAKNIGEKIVAFRH